MQFLALKKYQVIGFLKASFLILIASFKRKCLAFMKWTPEHGTNYVHLVLNVKLLEIETLHVLILGSCYMQKYLLIVWYSLLRAIQVYH